MKDFREMKRRGEKITALTAYDYPTARLLDESGIDIILVGDSVGMVVLGYQDTTNVTVDEMLHHTRAAARGVKEALLVADMPIHSYDTPAQAAETARKFVDAGAQAVKWSAGMEAPKLKAPANATDCHHHIYDARYPVDPKATLRPADALPDDYRALQKRIGTSRSVVVQPSTYGLDNRCTLDAVVALGPNTRAVVVVNDTVSDAELRRMDALGARGIRFNLAQAGATTPEMLEPLSKRVNALGWHIQINAPAAKIMEVCRSWSGCRPRSSSTISPISPSPPA